MVVSRVKLLTVVKQVFDENRIKFFPMYGTLLGFVRDGCILDWDFDIDMGAWYQDYDKILGLKDCFELKGYKLAGSGMEKRYCHINICPTVDFAYYEKDSLVKDVPFHVGINFWAIDKDKAVQLKIVDGSNVYNFFDKIYRSLILFINKHEVLPGFWFEDMGIIQACGLDFKVPSEYEEYLLKMYGSGWRIPDKAWSRKKHYAFNKLLVRYKFQDKKVKDLCLKR